jgi:hypothetical protein
MANAKTSLRGEQRELRERMRALGLSRRQIAVEFARRYGLRPRAAWRHAYGWSQNEAAERISDYAARSGLDPDGVTVAMTAPHLSEYEKWPGSGSMPAGRRPTPYLLALLASIYECAVHDLLDLADYERMPLADRLIIGKTAPVAIAHGQDPQGILRTGQHAEPVRPGILPRGESGSAESSSMAALAPMPWPPASSSAEPYSRNVARSRSHGPDTTRPFRIPMGVPDGDIAAAERPHLSAILPAGSAASAATTVDVAMFRSVLDALTGHERQFGGGGAHVYAMDYLQRMVWPRLHAASAPAFGDLCALATEFSLRVASMQLDAGNARASRDLLGSGLLLAQETGSPVLVAWVLARFGELDVREKNAGRAVAYTSGAAAMARRAAPRARSFILAKHALALSATGDRHETLRVLGQAQDSAARAGGSGEPEWMRFYGVEHLRHDQARCLINLGMGDQAILAAEESMRARRLSRPRAFSLAVQAVGHVRSKDNAVDRACQVGTEMVAITAELASDRVRVELARVMAALRPYRTSAAVRDLAEAARPALGDSLR